MRTDAVSPPPYSKIDPLPGVHQEAVVYRQPGRADAGREAWVRGARIVGHVVSAPAKLILTPAAGLTVGMVCGATAGFHMGTVLPLGFGAIISDVVSDSARYRNGGSRNGIKHGFEKGVGAACLIASMAVAVPVCAAAGAVLGAGAGAVVGTSHGLHEGYASSWAGTVPFLRSSGFSLKAITGRT